jgi:hypothetical protein
MHFDRRLALISAAMGSFILLAGCGAASTPPVPTARIIYVTVPATAEPTVAPTVAPTPVPTIASTPIPTVAQLLVPTDLIGEDLDVAEAELTPLGISFTAVGGGVFGIVVPSDWMVCETKPAAGKPVTGSVQLIVDHFSCATP